MLHFIRARTDVTFQAPLCDKHQCHVHNEDIQMQDVREVCCGEIEGWAKLWTIHQLIAQQFDVGKNKHFEKVFELYLSQSVLKILCHKFCFKCVFIN